MIELRVYNGNIKISRLETLTSGRVGHKIHFSFDNKWDGLVNKYANFEVGNLSKTIKLGAGHEITTEIPLEALQTPGYHLTVGVKGLDEELHTLLPTKYVDLGYIFKGSTILNDESIELIRKKNQEDGVASEQETSNMLHDIFEPCPHVASEDEIDEMLDNVFDGHGGCIPVATNEEIDEMLGDVFAQAGMNPPSLSIATEEEIDDMLDGVFN